MTRTPPAMDRGTALALVAMALGVFIIANDFTALSVALPVIEHDFDSDVDEVQWVINAYALVFGVLIVTGGRMADVFGRRAIFFIGCAIFALFSALAGAAQNELWLVASRALMGVGGAMIWPAVLGMTYAILPSGKAGLAGAIILGTAGLGNATGPLVGGLLTDTASWRWILFLNVPIAVFTVFVTWREIHLPPASAATRAIDYTGIAALSASLVALLIALDQVTDSSWRNPFIAGLLAGSAVFMALFVLVERRARDRALVPGDVMANRDFAAACVTVLLMSAVFFVAVVYLPQVMQKLFGYSPLEAGLGLLPLMAVFAATSFCAGSLFDRFGAKAVVSAGAALIATGMFLLSFVQTDSGYAALVPGMCVLGLGIGLFYSSVTTAGVTALDPSRASLAGGIVYMFQVAGGAIGLGITTTLFSAVSDARLAELASSLRPRITSSQLAALDGLLAGRESAHQAVSGFAPPVVTKLLAMVQDSFIAGFQASFRFDAALAAAGFLVAVLFVGGRAGSSRGVSSG